MTAFAVWVVDLWLNLAVLSVTAGVLVVVYAAITDAPGANVRWWRTDPRGDYGLGLILFVAALSVAFYLNPP